MFEFNAMAATLELHFTETQFRDRIVPEYGIKEKGVTFRGFCKFFMHLLNECGTDTFMDFVEKFGYDSCLINKKYRNFVLSFHSQEKLRVTRRDSVIEKMFLTPLIDYAI